MNNNDERDYAKESANREVLEGGDDPHIGHVHLHFQQHVSSYAQPGIYDSPILDTIMRGIEADERDNDALRTEEVPETQCAQHCRCWQFWDDQCCFCGDNTEV